jgi:hypothetical protein
MHYYSVFKDQPDFEANRNAIARESVCQSSCPSRSFQFETGDCRRAETDAPGIR